MKNFRQLIKELPSNRVVAAFGQFQPPTAGHEQLVKTVQTLATSADHVIYASTNEDKKHPLPVDRKVYFLKRMFSEANFQQAGFKTIVEAAYELSKKYKHLTVVTFADKVAEYEYQLKENNGKLYQFETIKVVSAGDIDPDNNTVSAVSGVAMCESAKKGNFTQFKKGVPHTLTELDSRRLMNDVRRGMGLEPIRETINLVKDVVREQYFRGEIFNIGDIVESAGQQYEIVKRGSNHLLVKGLDGQLVSKFITDVTEAVNDVTTAEVEKKSK
jgi:phosphopantetheine adenylyltransferase